MGYHLLSRWHWLKHLRDFFWETRAWLRNVTPDHVNVSWIPFEISDSNFTFQRTDVGERLTARQKKSELYFTQIFTKLLDYTSNWTNSLCFITKAISACFSIKSNWSTMKQSLGLSTILASPSCMESSLLSSFPKRTCLRKEYTRRNASGPSSLSPSLSSS